MFAPERSRVPEGAGALLRRLVGRSHRAPADHIYTHIGRGAGVGRSDHARPPLRHAFTVEMDHAMVGATPPRRRCWRPRTIFGSRADRGQLATLVRSLDYPALAHIDGNYRVIAPLVARDAGLARSTMGLVMTPELGPRVRLGVDTTDLPLAVDAHGDATSVLDFCRICRKCADNCPSRSIPFDDRREIDGALRWQIDSASCFRYWNVVGTDCGRCLAVSPIRTPTTPRTTPCGGPSAGRARPAVLRCGWITRLRPPARAASGARVDCGRGLRPVNPFKPLYSKPCHISPFTHTGVNYAPPAKGVRPVMSCHVVPAPRLIGPP